MIHANPGQERHTIPRWNSIKMAEKLGELSPAKSTTSSSEHLPNPSLDYLLEDWKEEKNLPLAIEIISTAKFTNNPALIDDVVLYAKNTISKMEHVPKLLHEIMYDTNDENIYPTDTHQSCIRKIKKSLAKYPHNPLLWTELSREYVICGQDTKGEKAISIAHNLAPNDRIILRSIARYYTHIGDFERALFYLRKSERIKSDPWILSSEIAISNRLKKSSKYTKVAQKLVESKSHTPLSISELASELGTMEFLAGNSKQGKKKLSLATIDPFENAIAQIAWINEAVYSIDGVISNIPKSVDCNYEAQTKLFIQSQNWQSAQQSAGFWQEYQPFSREPAIVSSFISLDFLNDYQKAKETLQCSLISNPHCVDLLNNYIYTLILSGQLEEANQIYEKTKAIDTMEQSIALIATGGMLNYRNHNPQAGSKLYLEAIDKFKKKNNLDMTFRALLCFAREEKLQGHSILHLLNEIEESKYSLMRTRYQAIIDNFQLYQ